ncbi:MAG: O-methyltransferase [Bacilli bacterium]
MRIEELEEYARKFNIPIMEPEGIAFLTNYIENNNIEKILEIGTAIGYSAIKMCMINDSITVTTIERDKERYDLAIENIKKFNLQNRITVVYGDALEGQIKNNFDLIFIDAAKSQSIKFFTKYEKNLNQNGTIITDNINFHGLTFTKDKIESRNVRQMIRKIHNYLDWLKENKDYKTNYENIGDGLTISKKIS